MSPSTGALSDATTSTLAISVPQRILVVGGGPMGLVTLRNLRERVGFEHVELYERRDDVGGVWYLDEPERGTSAAGPRWPSPAYPGLIGNVLPTFLEFSEAPFPEPALAPHQPFPSLTETYAHLRAFAEPYLQSGAIKLSREVVEVVQLEEERGWSVLSKDWTRGGEEVREKWDAVIVAVGWYDNPVWPKTEGLSELRAAGLAWHAQSWRGPQPYAGKKVLVVGNGNSGNDISAQLASAAATPVYQSIRRPAHSIFPSLPDTRIHSVAPVIKYTLNAMHPATFDALLADGRTLHDLEAVQISTGYRPLPTFVRIIPPAGGEPAPIVNEATEPHRVPGLHRLILHAYAPTLAFIGAALTFTPFQLADVASTWLGLAWRSEITVPETAEERLMFETERLGEVAAVRKKLGDASSLVAYSVLGPTEPPYATQLRREVVEARPDLDSVLPVWSEGKVARRQAMYQLKYESLLWRKNNLDQSSPPSIPIVEASPTAIRVQV